MNSQYFKLNQEINEIVKAPGDQGRIVAMAVAFAIALRAPLPSTPVDNCAEYFVNQVQQTAISHVSQLGEGVTFASKTALEYTEIFWKQRYYSAHPSIVQDNMFSTLLKACTTAEQRDAFDFSTIMSGGLSVMSIDTSKFLNKYKIEVAQLVQSIYWMLKCDETPVGDTPVAIG